MKCLLVHSIDWKDFDKRVAKMRDSINAKAPWLNLSIDLVQEDVQGIKTKMQKKNRLIDHDWFASEVTHPSYDITCLLLTKKQAAKFRLDKDIKGVHFDDGVPKFIEMYVVSDEKNTIKVKRAKQRMTDELRFEETFEHELKHGLCKYFGILDTVHKDNGDGYPDVLWGTFANIINSMPKPFVSQWGLLPKVDAAAIKLIANLTKAGIPIRITEGLRTYARQNALYAQGRTTPGKIVTTLKGGQSLHNHGVAFDVYPTKHGYGASKTIWEQIGKAGEAQGLEWGGNAEWKKSGFQDLPHFQLALGYSVNDFAKGKVDLTKFN